MTYPTAVTTFTAVTDGVDYPTAAQWNPVYTDLTAVETLLGVNGGSWISEGQMLNGKLSVTVATNDLTVALKTIAGTDPSTTNPVYVRINGTVRKCTAALSKTLVDGTNYFNAGSAELATKEVDYFAYLIWNTTPATDIVDLGFARKPHYTVYSEVSATATSENYLATSNASAPTSTDDMVNIGRFAATLSAGASYTWTVPTFTTTNLIQRPCFETRWLSYAPTIAGYSSVPTNTVYIYKVIGNNLLVQLREAANGVSSNATHTYTSPFTVATRTNMVWFSTLPSVIDNNTQEAAGVIYISSASATFNVARSALAAWTASGNCRIVGTSNLLVEI